MSEEADQAHHHGCQYDEPYVGGASCAAGHVDMRSRDIRVSFEGILTLMTEWIDYLRRSTRLAEIEHVDFLIVGTSP